VISEDKMSQDKKFAA
jgi:hypothetical protein